MNSGRRTHVLLCLFYGCEKIQEYLLLLGLVVGVLWRAHKLERNVELIYPRRVFRLGLQKTLYFIDQNLLSGFVSADELVVLRLVKLSD